MIGYTTSLTTSGQRSHHFVTLYSINNDTAYLQPVIADLCMRQKSIFKCCGSIGHKADACILRGPKFLPPSLIINMNKFNDLRGEEQNEPLREWNSQPTEVHFKSIKYPPKTIPVALAIMGILNHHTIDDGYVEVYPSYFLVESNFEYFTDLDTTMIKSNDDD